MSDHFNLGNFFERKQKTRRNIIMPEKLKGIDRLINKILDIMESKNQRIEDIQFSDIINLQEPMKTALIQYVIHNIKDFKVRIHTQRNQWNVAHKIFDIKCGDYIGIELALIIYHGRTSGKDEKLFGGYPQLWCEHCKQIQKIENEISCQAVVTESAIAPNSIEILTSEEVANLCIPDLFSRDPKKQTKKIKNSTKKA